MTQLSNDEPLDVQRSHPRTIGWVGTTALAMGGSNQSLYLIGALFVGQGAIPGQGSAAIPLLILGLLLSWAAVPGWTELVLLSPNRVGGIAAACSKAFEPYSHVLSALAASCYWWGWVPICGLAAMLAASIIHQWLLPWIAINGIAIAIICSFVAVNLWSIRLVVALAIPIAATSATLAFLSAFMPIVTGHVDWHQATTFHLTTPFHGWFGSVTSFMAGLYLIGFSAPPSRLPHAMSARRSTRRAIFRARCLPAPQWPVCILSSCPSFGWVFLDRKRWAAIWQWNSGLPLHRSSAHLPRP